MDETFSQRPLLVIGEAGCTLTVETRSPTREIQNWFLATVTYVNIKGRIAYL